MTDENQKESSAAPLIVDLPDGQKLMVGELPKGTIVEIATWRGTSRPDNRTTRLLLGVSSEEPESMEEEKAVPRPKVDRRADTKKRKSGGRRFTGLAVSIVAIIVFIVAFIASPAQLIHPTVGASAGFGKAESALVVAFPANEYKESTAIVAYLGDKKEQIVLGAVSQNAASAVLISTGTGFAQTAREKVIGRVVLVIPFLGKLFN